MKRGITTLCATILVCLFLHAARVPASEAENQAPDLESLVIGFSSGTLANVDPRDAKAATKIWADMILRRKGAKGESGAIIFSNLSGLEGAVREGSVDLVFLLPQEFLKIRNRIPIVPIVISTSHKGLFEQFVLLVRKDSPAETAWDLRNKQINVETIQKGTLPLMWLETLLMQEINGAGAERPFASIKATRKPSQTVLPVFFKQADGCIVSRDAFDTMVELNPQLGKELKVIASSPPYISSVGCLRKDFHAKHGALIAGELGLLHEDPQGRQLLTMFHKGKLVPFEEPYLENVAAVLKRHHDLGRELARRK